MFGRLKHIITFMVLWFALASCDKTIHEYPGTHDLKVIVECSVDTSEPTYFTNVECDPETGTSYVVRAQQAGTKGTRFDEPVCLRYIVDLYRETASSAVFVERKIAFSEVDAPNPQVAVEFTNVKAEKYKILVWCDYVQDDVRESWYYITDDLTKILYADVEVVDNNDKDVFTNMMNIDLTEYYYSEGDYEFRYSLNLERPKGKFRCISTDISDYLKEGKDVENITAVVSYVQYVSAGYNVLEQKPNYFEPTRTFITKARTTQHQGNDAIELCYDYVFVNGKQTNVKINFGFYEGDIEIVNGEVVGNKISQWMGIVVPLKRNKETIVEGRMLTTSFGTGGFGIDPSFENEIVIPWGD